MSKIDNSVVSSVIISETSENEENEIEDQEHQTDCMN
jgi:hypothetical protein